MTPIVVLLGTCTLVLALYYGLIRLMQWYLVRTGWPTSAAQQYYKFLNARRRYEEVNDDYERLCGIRAHYLELCAQYTQTLEEIEQLKAMRND